MFYLSNNYQLVHLNIENINQAIVLDENNPVVELIINEQTLVYDCNGDLYGTAQCNQCGAWRH